MKQIDASAAIFDLRNFTDNFSFFSAKNDDRFNKFVEKICSAGNDLALNISDEKDFYFNSTGDGFLILFFSENHFIKCYLWGLLFNYFAKEECKKFCKITEKEMSFGIGIESGSVEQIIIKDNPNPIYTYLGNVINVASRIESTTKTFARTTLIIGDEINQLLVKELYGINYQSGRRDAYNSYNEENTNKKYNFLNETNQKMLVNYIARIILKGVNKPLSIYRLSPHFFKKNHKVFKRLINDLSKIIGKENFVKDYLSKI